MKRVCAIATILLAVCMMASLPAAGAVDPQKIQDAKEQGTRLPSLHSSAFAPLPEPAIRTGVKAMTTAVEELLKKQ